MTADRAGQVSGEARVDQRDRPGDGDGRTRRSTDLDRLSDSEAAAPTAGAVPGVDHARRRDRGEPQAARTAETPVMSTITSIGELVNTQNVPSAATGTNTAPATVSPGCQFTFDTFGIVPEHGYARKSPVYRRR